MNRTTILLDRKPVIHSVNTLVCAGLPQYGPLLPQRDFLYLVMELLLGTAVAANLRHGQDFRSGLQRLALTALFLRLDAIHVFRRCLRRHHLLRIVVEPFCIVDKLRSHR